MDKKREKIENREKEDCTCDFPCKDLPIFSRNRLMEIEMVLDQNCEQ